MILVVDSGSTKTDWIALSDDGKHLFQTQTLGLNPQVLSQEIIRERIVNNFDLSKHSSEVSGLYFYGAGCGVEKPRSLIKEVFEEVFSNAQEVTIKEDTYAALYATAIKGRKSVICILGTGSNCSYFNGEILEQKVKSLGYIIMDDASGNYFGRQLIRDYKFGKIPQILAQKFETEYDLSSENIKNQLYKHPNPNTYLATFARFLIENKDEPYMQKLIRKGLTLFIEHQVVMQFPNAKEIPIHFVGSIGFYLQKELKEVLSSFELTSGTILKRPIDGLVKYHREFIISK
ncbi:N-acetylglucosamine kinase [Dokdonia sp. Hel_I_53]|uniref:N-acetylglucosamine kinase n=1 Tax=Dokdonia sp. Hel_I_53 TaxID=1566287 RepID=UPI00119A84C5|nr:N-acetylglucosamine kinase [Dokdonia sp. Hel_I_53]TVZ51161.1 N-acetylglucosamine kinase-like BadF-type ATPase [Dokdonia sp. Hel_I_53]